MTFASSIHRAAVLVKGLDEQQAVKLLSLLEPEQLEVLSNAIGTLDTIDDDQRVKAIKKLLQASRRHVGRQENDSDGKLETPFHFLSKVDTRMRCELLNDEHPRNIAIVLSMLPIRIASETLNGFDSMQRIAILRRLCRKDKTGNEELSRLSASIKKRWHQRLAKTWHDNGGIETASRLLSCTDVATKNGLFEALEGNDAKLLGDLKTKIIEFAELLNLSESDLKTLLARTDTSLWAPALVHCKRQVRRRIFDNLAELPSRILRKEIKQAGNVDFIVSSEAQAEIVSKMLELSEMNLIHIPEARRAA